jgi:hypothetical protein
MRHTFQEAAGAAVCIVLTAVLWTGGEAFGQDHAVAAPVHAQAKPAVAAPLHMAQPMAAVPQMRDLAAMHGSLMDKLRGALDVAVDLLSGNHTHLLSDIEAELLSNNKAELLSGNKTKVLSDISPNLLSGNKPEVLSNNQMPILSGNRVSFFSNLKIEIHIENAGNNNGNNNGSAVGPGSPMRPAPTAPFAPSGMRPAVTAPHAPGGTSAGAYYGPGSGPAPGTPIPPPAPTAKPHD